MDESLFSVRCNAILTVRQWKFNNPELATEFDAGQKHLLECSVCTNEAAERDVQRQRSQCAKSLSKFFRHISQGTVAEPQLKLHTNVSLTQLKASLLHLVVDDANNVMQHNVFMTVKPATSHCQYYTRKQTISVVAVV